MQCYFPFQRIITRMVPENKCQDHCPLQSFQRRNEERRKLCHIICQGLATNCLLTGNNYWLMSLILGQVGFIVGKFSSKFSFCILLKVNELLVPWKLRQRFSIVFPAPWLAEVSKVEWNVVFQTFFAPYLFYRSRNYSHDKLRSKFWREKMFRKPHLKLLRWCSVLGTNKKYFVTEE